MTVRLTDAGEIALEGQCASEDAEILLRHLAAAVASTVDLRACEFAHTAVIQVLMAAKPKLIGPPAGAVLGAWAYPNLTMTRR